uniref:Uncharacterized protein n=1 Tax=Lactuca sativa TaxID=4236 RepID=A0A9R1XPS1_LACSA|nr:hypothetical protein LSAT_V11C300141610 [Lactuca sativa]
MEPNMESPSHIDVAHISPPRMESPIEVESVREPNMEPPIMETFSEALGGSSDSEGSGGSTDSEDSDFIVDEDNLLDDPEVDIVTTQSLFRYITPLPLTEYSIL